MLLGPRQVGKTTSVLKMLDEHFKDKAHYVSADGVFNASSEWLLESWRKAQAEKKILPYFAKLLIF